MIRASSLIPPIRNQWARLAVYSAKLPTIGFTIFTKSFHRIAMASRCVPALKTIWGSVASAASANTPYSGPNGGIAPRRPVRHDGIEDVRLVQKLMDGGHAWHNPSFPSRDADDAIDAACTERVLGRSLK